MAVLFVQRPNIKLPVQARSFYNLQSVLMVDDVDWTHEEKYDRIETLIC